MENLAILVDGPYPNANRQSDWEEFPEWTVCKVDEDGCEIGKIYYCRSYDTAFELGEKMRRDTGLELLVEASPYW